MEEVNKAATVADASMEMSLALVNDRLMLMEILKCLMKLKYGPDQEEVE